MFFENRMPLLRSLLKNRFLQVTLFVLMLAGVATSLAHVAPAKAQEPQPVEGGRLSLLVEQGFVLPAQLLVAVKNQGTAGNAIFAESAQVPEQFKSGTLLKVTFTISGNARFDTPQGLIAVADVENGTIMTPPIVAGPTFGESFIDVIADGRTVIKNLRVATLETGGIESLKKIIGADNSGLIVLSDHYAIVDESKMRETTETVTGRVELLSKTSGKTSVDPEKQALPQIDEQITLGVCFRSPEKPGWVNWDWESSTPWATGGWAYKPEEERQVYRASDRVSDAIDGLYRKSWGCDTAYKVPNSCTVKVYPNDSLTYCCNAAMWALGYRVGFVDSSALGNSGVRCPW